MQKKTYSKWLAVGIFLISLISTAAQKDLAVDANAKQKMEADWTKLKSANKDTPLAWQTRLTDPLADQYPAKEKITFYAMARGLNMNQPTAGESIGPVWGQITYDIKTKTYSWQNLNRKLEASGKQGVRPLTDDELKILNLKPFDLLLESENAQNKEALKKYYELQVKLGNIPAEIAQKHSAFLKSLGI